MEDLGDGAYQQGLGETRRTRDEAVPTRKEAEEELHHHLPLPDDDFRQLGRDPVAAGPDLRDSSFLDLVGVGGIHQRESLSAQCVMAYTTMLIPRG